MGELYPILTKYDKCIILVDGNALKRGASININSFVIRRYVKNTLTYLKPWFKYAPIEDDSYLNIALNHNNWMLLGLETGLSHQDKEVNLSWRIEIIFKDGDSFIDSVSIPCYLLQNTKISWLNSEKSKHKIACPKQNDSLAISDRLLAVIGELDKENNITTNPLISRTLDARLEEICGSCLKFLAFNSGDFFQNEISFLQTVKVKYSSYRTVLPLSTIEKYMFYISDRLPLLVILQYLLTHSIDAGIYNNLVYMVLEVVVKFNNLTQDLKINSINGNHRVLSFICRAFNIGSIGLIQMASIAKHHYMHCLISCESNQMITQLKDSHIDSFFLIFDYKLEMVEFCTFDTFKGVDSFMSIAFHSSLSYIILYNNIRIELDPTVKLINEKRNDYLMIILEVLGWIRD